MTELLHPQLIDPDQFQHRWIYSVVPARIAGTSWSVKQEGNIYNEVGITEIGIWLAGYCGDCRRVFSNPIPFGTEYQEAFSSVPRFGCVGPLAGL